jgi:low molecular weight protein-tyrosine phosphatase
MLLASKGRQGDGSDTPRRGIVISMDSGAGGRGVEIVFVCTGNRARSPLAEALLRGRVSDQPVRVGSRGTGDVGTVPVLREMASAAARLGVDLTAHRATPLAPMELRDTDLVVGFEPFHVAAAVVDGGAPRKRVFTLPELVELLSPLDNPPADLRERLALHVADADSRRASTHWSAASVPDPLGAPQRVFDETATSIAGLVTRLADVLFTHVAALRGERVGR